jgi:hypothetical protein
MSHISTISIYEGSYQISCGKTHFVVTEEFIADELGKLNTYRKSEVGYWAEVEQDGVVTRHTLKDLNK